MSTARLLVSAAADLLDEGGDAAMTLRAVASRVGVSHNAPYKHFESRRSLLCAVARQDVAAIWTRWRQLLDVEKDPIDRILDALDVVIAFSQEHPARYRLLFGMPDALAADDTLTEAIEGALGTFAQIVRSARTAGRLPDTSSHDLAILLFASTHGLIDAQAGGRLESSSGWDGVETGVQILLRTMTLD